MKTIRDFFINQFKDAPKEFVEQVGEAILGNGLSVLKMTSPDLLKEFNKEFNVVERDRYADRELKKYMIHIQNKNIKVSQNEVLKEIKLIEKQVKEIYQ